MLASATTAATAVFRVGARTTAPMFLLRCNSGCSGATVPGVAPFSSLAPTSSTTTTTTTTTPTSPNPLLAALPSSQSVAAPKLPSQPTRRPFSTAAFRPAHPAATGPGAAAALTTLAKTRPSYVLLRCRPPLQQPCHAVRSRPSSTLSHNQNQQPPQQQPLQRPIDTAPAARDLDVNTATAAIHPASKNQALRSESSPTSPASPTPAPTPAPAPSQPLDWDSFFRLRKTRRRWQLAFSVTLALGLGFGGAVLLGSGLADSVTAQIPLEPMISLGLVVLGTALLGWLLGPSVGNAVFNATNAPHVRVAMVEKEAQFFARVRKYRVDPSGSSSMGNTIPDFYGEKISSVAGYRQWLKDQRAFNKKRTTFF